MKAAGHALTSVQTAATGAIHANPVINHSSLAELIAHDRATFGGVVERLEAKG
jgi:DNA-binding MarR family transcriptional regulator